MNIADFLVLLHFESFQAASLQAKALGKRTPPLLDCETLSTVQSPALRVALSWPTPIDCTTKLPK